MRRSVKIILALLALLLLLVSVPLVMQYDSGSIQGVVSSGGRPVSGASIEARNLDSDEVSSTVSGALGQYRAGRLPSGRYSLWVEAPGHGPVSIPLVTVARGEEIVQDIPLTPAR